MTDNSVKLIKPAWHNTLEFLAGILDEEKAIELIEKMSSDYLKIRDLKTKGGKFLGEIFYRSELYLIGRCIAERGYIMASRAEEDCSVTVLSDDFLRITPHQSEINLSEERLKMILKCNNAIIKEVGMIWLDKLLEEGLLIAIPRLNGLEDRVYLFSTGEKYED